MNWSKNFIGYFYLLLALVGGSLTFYYVMLGTSEAHGSFNVIELFKVLGLIVIMPKV